MRGCVESAGKRKGRVMRDGAVSEQKATIPIEGKAVVFADAVGFDLNTCHLPVAPVGPGRSLLTRDAHRNLIHIAVEAHPVDFRGITGRCNMSRLRRN